MRLLTKTIKLHAQNPVRKNETAYTINANRFSAPDLEPFGVKRKRRLGERRKKVQSFPMALCRYQWNRCRGTAKPNRNSHRATLYSKRFTFNILICRICVVVWDPFYSLEECGVGRGGDCHANHVRCLHRY